MESDDYHSQKYLHDDEHTLLKEGVDYTQYDDGVYEVKHEYVDVTHLLRY